MWRGTMDQYGWRPGPVRAQEERRFKRWEPAPPVWDDRVGSLDQPPSQHQGTLKSGRPDEFHD